MSCQIVINGDIRIIGLDGTKRWFKNQEPYCYTRLVRLLVSCDSCNKQASNHLVWYYEVEVDDEIFRIPKTGATEVSQPILGNPVKYGTGEPEEYVDKTIYEQVDKDEDYPSNGDYLGYIEKKLGVKPVVGPVYSGDVWYNQVVQNGKIKRHGGLKDADTTS